MGSAHDIYGGQLEEEQCRAAVRLPCVPCFYSLRQNRTALGRSVFWLHPKLLFIRRNYSKSQVQMDGILYSEDLKNDSFTSYLRVGN